jgi:hypothetical protein
MEEQSSSKIQPVLELQRVFSQNAERRSHFRDKLKSNNTYILWTLSEIQ